ncbi:hypothetical protein L596_000697 [Steinernema carpocapsae]|uniref:SKP1 component POZ domain-containing protein n=1 Tax=Steinernema carpocapsae TaxID=34508 RepID=A0A4U8UJ76_STECR|nr:hypothetical protein L596_000697 [Steinernema carpocapsae]
MARRKNKNSKAAPVNSTEERPKSTPPATQEDGPMILIQSSDDQMFQTPLKSAYKMGEVKTMLESLGFHPDDGVAPPFPLPFMSVSGPSLKVIVEWLKIHENREPLSPEQLCQLRTKNIITDADVQLLDNCTRSELLDLRNTGCFLDMPAFVSTWTTYIAMQVDAPRNSQDFTDWFEAAPGRRRNQSESDADQPGTSAAVEDAEVLSPEALTHLVAYLGFGRRGNHARK